MSVLFFLRILRNQDHEGGKKNIEAIQSATLLLSRERLEYISAPGAQYIYIYLGPLKPSSPAATMAVAFLLINSYRSGSWAGRPWVGSNLLLRRKGRTAAAAAAEKDHSRRIDTC